MKKCRKGFNIEILRSAAGYYKGTVDEKGFLNCRLSEYASSPEEAKILLTNRKCIENNYCNGGKGCMIKEFKACPKCGKEYSDRSALSRRDNKTEICPDCGMREALEDAGIC